MVKNQMLLTATNDRNLWRAIPARDLKGYDTKESALYFDSLKDKQEK